MRSAGDANECGLCPRGIALRKRGCVGVLRLLHLRRRNQVRLRLRTVAVKLLLGVDQPVFSGFQLLPCVGEVVAQISLVEHRQHLTLLDGIADAHAALDHFAGNTERQRRGVPRLHLPRQCVGDGVAVRVQRQRNDRFGRADQGFAVVAAREQHSAAGGNDKRRSFGTPDDGQVGARCRLRMTTRMFHDVSKQVMA